MTGGRAGLNPPPKPFTLIQHNCLRSREVFLSLFGSFSQLALTLSIIVLQDPPVYRGTLPSFQLYTCFSPLCVNGAKPCVAFYVFSTCLSAVTLLPKFYGRNDIMALELFTPEGFFNPFMVGITVVNCYSTKGWSNNTRSVPPDLILPSLPGPVLTLGHLNIHHPSIDPLRSFKDDELATSVPYFDRAIDLGYSLLNTHGEYTGFSMYRVGRPGVIDLAFACPLLAPYFSEWSDPLPSPGSDHIPILLCFDSTIFRAPPPRTNWALTDWVHVDVALKSLTISSSLALPTSGSLATWFDTNQNITSAPLGLHTPLKRVTHRSKQWWTASLSMLRKGYNSALRSSKQDCLDASLLASARAARSSYFKARKKGKRDHWRSFLATATPQSVWTANKPAIGRPPPRFPEHPRASTLLELNKSLLDHFFPAALMVAPSSILLPSRECPELVTSEIESALACSSPSSAPGPDVIPNSVWKTINRTAPPLILKLLSPLISYGFHPPSLKKADSIVLDRPGKPSYASPSSLRVRVLLQTFSKILEMVMNNRLSCVAQMTSLYNPHQCGSQPGLSVSDTCTTLTHEVRTLQMDKRKVSTLFLDINGGFDNINPFTLCWMLSSQGVKPYLVFWTRSFLTGRFCHLVCQCSPTLISMVSVGILQGSPVSPLLFVIYVSRFHVEIPYSLTLSYVDDFALTASSTSYLCNIQLLQRHYALIKAKGSRLGVGFSIPKTDRNWRTSRDKNLPSQAHIHLDGITILLLSGYAAGNDSCLMRKQVSGCIYQCVGEYYLFR